MYIVGLNWSMHDASACLLKDGTLVAFAEEERFNREKHTCAFPENALRFCLETAGIEMKDVDHAAFFWNPFLYPWRRILFTLRYFPATLARLGEQKAFWTSMVSTEKLLRNRLGFRGKFHFISHYDAHCASGFYLSPFESAAILTLDGNGEMFTTRYAVGKGSGFETLGEVPYPHSIGLIYASITQYLGFYPLCDEGKVMGLASYGKPEMLDDLNRICVLRKDGDYRVDTSYFNYHTNRKGWVSKKFVKKFGPPRKPRSELTSFHENMASSLQVFTEEIVLQLLRELHQRTGETNLCYTGGVALNSVLNGRILRETGFEEMFLMPVANDAGCSLGAALYLHSNLLGLPRTEPIRNAYWGPEFSDGTYEKAFEAHGLSWHRFDNIEAEIARKLTQGLIFGWFQGRMEAGPRALGNRSIIADPRSPEMKDILNAKVKHREGFRPFAPSVLEEHLTDWFDGDKPSPYMLRVYPVLPEKRSQVPAITHVDGTGRVQTVSQSQNPRYYRLIEEFHKLTGVPMILNTSFNVQGEPIVCTPEQAVRCFLSTHMDGLVLGNYVVEKNT